MAFVTLGQALEMALKRLELDCAATAGTDADAEKMAAALDQQQPPSQGGTIIVGTKGIAGLNVKCGNASRGHTPTAPPTGRNKLTGNPNALAPERPVSLFLIVDNEKAGRQTEGRRLDLPTDRASRGGAARETGLRVVGGRGHAAFPS